MIFSRSLFFFFFFFLIIRPPPRPPLFPYPPLSRPPGAPAATHSPPLYSAVLAPLFGFLSLAGAALVGKLLNVVCAAAACGLIAWHATRTELVGEGGPRWLAGGVGAAGGPAGPFFPLLLGPVCERRCGLLLSGSGYLADRPP